MNQETGKEAEDPSMEDILASIRRILNDDEPAAEGAHEAPASAGPDAAHAPAPPHDDVFVLDQSMLVEEPPPISVAAAPVIPAIVPATIVPPPALPEPSTEPQQAPPAPMNSAPNPITQPEPDEALLAPSTVAAASASMGALVRVVGQQQAPVYRGGPTLEDMVRDEIRPLVKSWLDEHLAPMVERMVRAEIARVTEGK